MYINLVHRIRGTTVSDKKKDTTTAQPCNGSAFLVENRSSLFLAMLSFTMPKHEDPPTPDSSMKKSNFNGGVWQGIDKEASTEPDCSANITGLPKVMTSGESSFRSR
ncbi:hypothetical protein H0G86_005623 [Trichoderma simmonsii]|uniref:Uncharacterized protein n=1 Tax=Trichoderma simmonsii TaxID=1491479 RepID=A0A8G0PGJ8_9HYPO|nr:hypothetical protein H0G86_005623 [Trichoderma simmonsii]